MQRPAGILVSDFDGTISRRDFFDLVRARWPIPKQEDPWERYVAGEITHFEALALIFGRIRCSEAELLSIVAQMEVDPAFASTVNELHSQGWEVVVASAGCAWYIDRLLAQAGLSIPVYSNPGTFDPARGLVMSLPPESPFFDPGTGVNKLAITRAALLGATAWRLPGMDAPISIRRCWCRRSAASHAGGWPGNSPTGRKDLSDSTPGLRSATRSYAEPETNRHPHPRRVKPGALERVGIYATRHEFRRIALFYSKDLSSDLHDALTDSLVAERIAIVSQVPVEAASFEEAAELAVTLPSRIDAIIGFGGGKALDVAKYVAFLSRLPYVAVPTSLSNDGICSPQSSLTVAEKRRSFPSSMPMGVIIDTRVCLGAPEVLWHSGVGDLVAKFTAVADWKLAFHAKGEPVDDFAALLSDASVYQFIGRPEYDLEGMRLLGSALLLNGISMAICGSSRPASGSEHLISHALDSLSQRPRLHGLQVGVASYLMSLIHGPGSSRDHRRAVRLHGILAGHRGRPVLIAQSGWRPLDSPRRSRPTFTPFSRPKTAYPPSSRRWPTTPGCSAASARRLYATRLEDRPGP